MSGRTASPEVLNGSDTVHCSLLGATVLNAGGCQHHNAALNSLIQTVSRVDGRVHWASRFLGSRQSSPSAPHSTECPLSISVHRLHPTSLSLSPSLSPSPSPSLSPSLSPPPPVSLSSQLLAISGMILFIICSHYSPSLCFIKSSQTLN